MRYALAALILSMSPILAVPVSAQELATAPERVAVPTVTPAVSLSAAASAAILPPGPVAVTRAVVRSDVLEREIEEARQSYQRNRRIGHGLVAVGAAAIMGALTDWAGGSGLGMRTEATGVMIGGLNLMLWGAERHYAARHSLEHAEALEAGSPDR